MLQRSRRPKTCWSRDTRRCRTRCLGTHGTPSTHVHTPQDWTHRGPVSPRRGSDGFRGGTSPGPILRWPWMGPIASSRVLQYSRVARSAACTSPMSPAATRRSFNRENTFHAPRTTKSPASSEPGNATTRRPPTRNSRLRCCNQWPQASCVARAQVSRAASPGGSWLATTAISRVHRRQPMRGHGTARDVHRTFFDLLELVGRTTKRTNVCRADIPLLQSSDPNWSQKDPVFLAVDREHVDVSAQRTGDRPQWSFAVHPRAASEIGDPFTRQEAQRPHVGGTPPTQSQCPSGPRHSRL